MFLVIVDLEIRYMRMRNNRVVVLTKWNGIEISVHYTEKIPI